MMYSEASAKELDTLVAEHAPLVKRIALHLMLRFPANVQLDDLIQAGLIGLLEAASNYSGGKGATFATYAGIRIRGAMIDDVRKGDWAPRSVHRNSRRVKGAMQEIEARTGREAQDAEIAAELGVELDEYYNYLQDANSSRLCSLEELTSREDSFEEPVDQSAVTPPAALQRNAMKSAVVKEIDNLPERERMVLALYYDEELNLKEIGAVLGVSESRVSQIHSQAMLRIRSRLGDWSE